MEVESKNVSPQVDTMTRAARLAAWLWNLTLPALCQAPVVTWREMWVLLITIGLSISTRWPKRPHHQNDSPKG